jgi:hypothetical protein
VAVNDPRRDQRKNCQNGFHSSTRFRAVRIIFCAGGDCTRDLRYLDFCALT